MEFVFESDNNQHSMSSGDIISPVGTGISNSSRRTTRRSVPTSFSDIEFNEPVKRTRRRATGPKVSYVKSPKKKKRVKTAKFEWTWMKVGWLICVALVLRLFFMESGVIDYYQMNQVLEQKDNDLISLRQENAELIREIHKIKTSPAYQKKLARDHLGVLAKDEYLVLFSRESRFNTSF